MDDVVDHLEGRAAAVESVPGDRRAWQQQQRGDVDAGLEHRIDRGDRREHRADRGHDRDGRRHAAETTRDRHVVQQPGDPDEHEQVGAEEEPHRHGRDCEAEERSADGRQ